MREFPDLPNSALSLDDALALVDWCVAVIGLGYHPDTAADEYSSEDGQRLFSNDTAERLDELHEQAFAAGHAEQMYARGLELFHSVFET